MDHAEIQLPQIFAEVAQQAELIRRISDVLIALQTKRITLEEKMICGYLQDLAILLCEIARQLHNLARKIVL